MCIQRALDCVLVPGFEGQVMKRCYEREADGFQHRACWLKLTL
jgi:hypothetical protein